MFTPSNQAWESLPNGALQYLTSDQVYYFLSNIYFDLLKVIKYTFDQFNTLTLI